MLIASKLLRGITIFGFRHGPWMVANHLVKIVVPSQILHVARRAISTVVLKFLHFMGGLSCALIKTLIFVQVCDCAAH